jgi:hypothetical protein
MLNAWTNKTFFLIHNGKKIFWRPKLSCEDESKIYLKEIVCMWTASIWLRIGPCSGVYEIGNVPSGSIKGWGFRY